MYWIQYFINKIYGIGIKVYYDWSNYAMGKNFYSMGFLSVNDLQITLYHTQQIAHWNSYVIYIRFISSILAVLLLSCKGRLFVYRSKLERKALYHWAIVKKTSNKQPNWLLSKCINKKKE